jgi:8-oxo-dGTP pyrophosphatase MutT (NUDIX family)
VESELAPCIYLNDKPIFLVKGRKKDADKAWQRTHPSIFYKRKGDVQRALWLMEHDHLFDSLAIYGKDTDAVRKEVFGMFRIMEAAGGLVLNPNGKSLMIFRRGKWDLPKGKLDKGETPEEAALREVNEETGIKKLKLEGHLITTYHSYTHKKQRILKRTYWYLMTIPNTQKATPQAEEDITLAKWVAKDKLKAKLKNTYPSILDVFIEAKILPEKLAGKISAANRKIRLEVGM